MPVPTLSIPSIASRDPAWIRARLALLLADLAPIPDTPTPERPPPDWPERLDAPVTADELALCVQTAEMALLVGLSQVEHDLMLIATAMAWVPPFDGLLVHVQAPTRHLLVRALARAIGSTARQVRAVLAEGSLLWELSDLRLEGERPVSLELDPEFATLKDFGDPEVTAAEVLGDITPLSAAPTLPLTAHAHLGDVVEVARALLAGALRSGAQGVHVLLHGAPGLGKTELARALGHAVASQTRVVRTSSASGGSRAAWMRLHDWNAAQRLHTSARGLVLIFDEAEDAIRSVTDTEENARSRAVAKGFFTQRLETTPVPTIWTANEIGDLDPAYRRRFTLVVHVTAPPVGERVVLARDLLGAHGVDEATVRTVASVPSATPALLAQTARALSLMGTDRTLDAGRATVALLRGHQPELDVTDVGALTDYDPELLEFEDGVDVAGLADRLGGSGQGRVLLHGPPGTGKSAFARFVAERSGRPLVSHDAASLLSKWVGETEKQIASAFAEAARSRAVLVLDEVDALFFRRDTASASWEGSQVAQALLEVERFPGVLVATSNLLPRIDEAFHRRFDLVLGVRAPGPARRTRLVHRLARDVGVDPPDAATIASLAGLVPGHLRQLARRWQLVGAPTSTAALVDALEAVVRTTGRRAPVGFTPSPRAPTLQVPLQACWDAG